MEKKIIKVEVILELPNLKEVLPLGFQTVIEVIHHEKDVEIFPAQYRLNKETMKREFSLPAVFAPKGSYKDSTFIGVNGEKYSSNWITGRVGYSYSYKEIFKKI